MITNELLEKIAQLDNLPSDIPTAPPAELVAFFVRMVRGMRQWKQTTLADFARVSLSTVERVERGEKVSEESLDRIALALGYDHGYLTTPRNPCSPDEVAAQLERMAQLEPVAVAPLRKHRQVRDLANCQAYLIHRPDVPEAYDDDIASLAEWLDLASFILTAPLDGLPSPETRRRDLYEDILSSVQELEQRGLTVLSGVMHTPREGIPNWKVALLSITPKLSDPGAPKRRYVLVDRRNVH